MTLEDAEPGLSQAQHYTLFPLGLGQILNAHGASELHLALNAGQWDYKLWGSPPEPSVASGAELWTWMRARNTTEADARWVGLRNALAGVFCASLGSLDDQRTTTPALSFRPSVPLPVGKHELRHATLPAEHVCTGNLTPFVKLLPCTASAGLATLLNPHALFSAPFHGLSVHYKAGVLKLAVQAVFTPPRQGPIGRCPRPKDDKKKDKDKGRDWLALQLRETLVDLKYVTPTQAVVLQHAGVERTFIVHSASGPDDALLESKTDESSVTERNRERKDVWTVSWDTIVHIVEPKPPPTPEPPAPDSDAYTSVGGLDAQIRAVRDLIDIPLLHPERFLTINLPPPRGVLLFGPPGTGKTHLARAIAKGAGPGVLVVNGPELVGMYHGQTEERLRSVFEEARRKGRCVVVLDEMDALCPRSDGGDGGEAERRAVATLLTLMDGMDQDHDGGGGARVVVVATTNRPNAIDPALRRPGVPDAPARLQILQALLSKTPHTLSQPYLTSLSATLHGFVGADLASLIRSAGTLAIQRSSPTLDAPDIALALPSIRPSALREVEIQSQRSGSWEDVGGMQSVRRALEQAVVWPLRHRSAFERLGVRGGARGVLMYGPPGCSKTLVARALAAEGGVNFIAVRGAELLNKYVGESERAVRDVFRKARAASPCVIFFDELDALGTTRDDERASAHVGVLTTLLNEMDGIGSAVGVTVVAATNRPQVIDPALLRPGRLDRVLFVGPPDASARVEILKVHTRTLTVDTALDLNLLASMTEGCSGAEIAAMCQDAAMRAMARDIDTPFIAQEDFVDAARGVRRAVTRKMLDEYEEWQRTSGMPAV